MFIEMINETMVRKLLPKRAADACKRDFGNVLIIAGSEGMMGAAVLCAEASLRGGAGLATICCPREFFTIPQTSLPEAMCLPREPELLGAERLNSYDAIAFGPGLGRGEDVKELLARIFAEYEGILVLDADGLNALAENPEMAAGHKCLLIMTPHAGEAGRLLGSDAEEVNAAKDVSARSISEKYGATVVVKGKGSVVCLEGGRLYVNSSGNPGMATAGAGDVLTGLIAALAAQFSLANQDPALAALAAAWLHGRAGDIAANDFGEYSLMAGDISNSFSLAFPEDR
ncbi:MAG TPA: NAD(P)H-hydrate dehydratase [Bacillota bacterium]|nr:NAD(P)H-hydrate dehydratase [Bacillota bacterium]